MSIKKCKSGKGSGAGNWQHYNNIDERRKAYEKVAKKLIEYVEKHENVYDWSQIKAKWSFNYKRVCKLAQHWACVKEAKDHVNKIFEGRLVNLGVERSKLSDSFVKFLLERRHGWIPVQKVEADVRANLSFRDLVSGETFEQKDDIDDSEDFDIEDDE